MSIKSVLCGVLLVLAVSLVARADMLILEDGTELSGTVTQEGDVYTIVTDDGQTKEFHKDQVKRFIYECSLAPQELLEMFDEYEGLVRPALEEKEPDQHQWLSHWREYVSTYVDEHGGERVSRGESSSPPLAPRDRPVGSDEFVDEWTRYTAKFRAVAENFKYKKLVEARIGSNSLKDFALRPPEECEDAAIALRTSIRCVEQCLTLCETTLQQVTGLPRQQVAHNRKIRKLEDDAKEAHDKADMYDKPHWRSNEQKEKKRYEKYRKQAVKADDDLRKQISKMESSIEQTTRTADDQINRLAQERELALAHLATARDLLAEMATRRAASESASEGRSHAPSGPPGVLSDAIRDFERVVGKHRSQAQDMTSLHRNALRTQTTNEINGLFVGRDFTLQLYVKNIEEAQSGGYLLTAEDGENNGGKAAHRVSFHFADDLADDLVNCRVGVRVRLVARVEQVAFSPGLQSLEQNDQPASLTLTGGVVSVQSGCH
ncbi:MAG TPA: hypothetical protein VM243_15395 [Phycisphaerae bacterium]|nr:hypothetical protein [Phycisphaerae bacterium]